jgi:hypothetical protein
MKLHYLPLLLLCHCAFELQAQTKLTTNIPYQTLVEAIA